MKLEKRRKLRKLVPSGGSLRYKEEVEDELLPPYGVMHYLCRTRCFCGEREKQWINHCEAEGLLNLEDCYSIFKPDDMHGGKDNSEVALIRFNSLGSFRPVFERIPWTLNYGDFMRSLHMMKFEDGEPNDAPTTDALAHALTMFAIPPNGYNTIDENLDGKRHCILIASSNPYPYARLISRPNIDGCGKSQLYANAQTVAQWFGQCSVSLSVICPRNLPKIRALYEVAKRNPKSEDPLVQVPGPDYLVLISEDFKEALSALAATIPAPCQNAMNRASPAPCQNPLDPTSQVPNQDAMDPTNPSEADLNPQDALEPRKLASSQDTLHPVRPASAHDALNSASPAAAQEAVAPLHPEFGASTSHRPDSIPTNKTLNLSSLQAPSLPVLPQDLFWNIKNIQCTDTDSVESMLDTIFECDICFSKSLETTTTTTTTQKQSSSNLPETSHTILGQAIALEDTLLNMPPKSKMKFACSNSSRGFEATTHTSKVLKGTSSTKDMIPLLSQTQTSSHLPETTHNLLELLTASPKSGVGEQPNDPNYFAPSVEVIASQKGLANAQYVILWEGDLRVRKSGKSVAIFELEAYRMKSASERLAEDWPYSIRIACLMPLQKLNHKYDGSRAVVLIFKVMTSNRFPKLLKEKGLGAIVDLPNQTLILTVSDDTTRLIGSLFPKVPQTRRYRRRKH